MKRLLGLLIILSFIIAMSFVLIVAGNTLLPGETVRGLAVVYLRYAFNKDNPDFTVFSPEAVTSIVWDYRGLDTVFETMVFFLAIIGAVALARGVAKPEKPEGKELGLSLIVKTVTRITSVLIIVVAASIALHGHLTPGGGFQGGATAAVAPLLILIVFSQYFLIERGVSKDLMLGIRSIGLTGIGIVAVIAYIIGLLMNKYAYVLQNQAKPTSPVSIPAWFNGQLISGTLWFFNLFEFLAVMAGFTIVFLLLTIPERVYKAEEKKEGEQQ